MNQVKSTISVVVFLLLNYRAISQDQLVKASGMGSSYEIARTNALRSAVENTFGAFISTETKIKNDILESDKTYSTTSGYIKRVQDISKSNIGDEYSVTIEAVISPEKLSSFVKSKGIDVEYNGSLYASNLRIQKMNEYSEQNSVRILSEYAETVIPKCFDIEVTAKDPYKYPAEWVIKIDIIAKANNNLNILLSHIDKTLRNISLNASDIETRRQMGMYPYGITIQLERNEALYNLRSNESRSFISDIFAKMFIEYFKTLEVLMDAGSYSKSIAYTNDPTDRNGTWGLSLTDIAFVAQNNWAVEAGEVHRLKYLPNTGNVAAKLTYDLGIRGLNALEEIGSIKGFKLVKK